MKHYNIANIPGDGVGTEVAAEAIKVFDAAAKKAGKSVDEATAAFSVAKYAGYKNENVKAAIQVIYDESK